MALWDPGRGAFIAVNQAALDQYGYTREEFLVLDRGQLGAIHGTNWKAAPSNLLDGEAHGYIQPVQHRTKDGRLIDVELSVRRVDFSGRPVLLVVARDVTHSLALQRELEHQAFHDALTSLPNRVLFSDRLQHAHRRRHRTEKSCAVLMLDLDNFKTVNDGLGHDAGDQLLRCVAQRLADSVRPGDTVARLGGDEFGILLEDLDDEASAVTAAQRLLDSLVAPLQLAGRTVTVSATVGIATIDDDLEASSALRNADAALYVGKAQGKGVSVVFTPGMHSAALERLNLEQDLRLAIEREELVVVYQPKVSTSGRGIAGVEALVRWNHPTRGLLMPDSFIPIAEASGLIAGIDAFVLERACTQVVTWSREHHLELSLAVNVSTKELAEAGFVERLRDVLRRTRLAPTSLELEITEHEAMQQESTALATLRGVRDLGVRVAIDDFGTGYSMLTRLLDFPVDTLKIDRRFVSAINDERSDAPLVTATVAIAQELGLDIVAEGVETAAQQAYLVAANCHYLQGYLFSPPVGAERIPELARALETAPV